jgi:hypothetical protein
MRVAHGAKAKTASHPTLRATHARHSHAAPNVHSSRLASIKDDLTIPIGATILAKIPLDRILDQRLLTLTTRHGVALVSDDDGPCVIRSARGDVRGAVGHVLVPRGVQGGRKTA